MGYCHRPLILEDCLDGRVVEFSDKNHWQLTEKISEKPWEGSYEAQREEFEDWLPHEAHAVYECRQVRGSKVGAVAIMKIRLEVPHHLPPSDDPKERAKDASGMRLNDWTDNEIKILQRLTTARCSVTPTLLASKIDVQDESVLNSRGKPGFEEQWGENKQWWMPGGYIVYILMTKLHAQPLDIKLYWNDKKFGRQQRDEVRSAFQAAYLELRGLGIVHHDHRLENLMWNRAEQKCYIIDMECADYNAERSTKGVKMSGYQFFAWNLARHWAEPNW